MEILIQMLIVGLVVMEKCKWYVSCLDKFKIFILVKIISLK